VSTHTESVAGKDSMHCWRRTRSSPSYGMNSTLAVSMHHLTFPRKQRRCQWAKGIQQVLIITLAFLLDVESRITASSFASTCCSTDLGLGMHTCLGWLPMIWRELPLGDRNPLVIDGACTPSRNRWCAWNRCVACPVCMALSMPRCTAKLLCFLCPRAIEWLRGLPDQQNKTHNKTKHPTIFCVCLPLRPQLCLRMRACLVQAKFLPELKSHGKSEPT